jgi:hypothetical protein
MKQKPEIGHPLKIEVKWYDNVPEPPKVFFYDGEIIGWRDTQVIIRVKDYAVCRFWKKSGLEVGNTAHALRGLSIDLGTLDNSLKPPKGVEVPIAIDTDS